MNLKDGGFFRSRGGQREPPAVKKPVQQTDAFAGKFEAVPRGATVTGFPAPAVIAEPGDEGSVLPEEMELDMTLIAKRGYAVFDGILHEGLEQKSGDLGTVRRDIRIDFDRVAESKTKL